MTGSDAPDATKVWLAVADEIRVPFVAALRDLRYAVSILEDIAPPVPGLADVPAMVVFDTGATGIEHALHACARWRAAAGPDLCVLLLVDPADEAIVDRGRAAGATDFAVRRSPASLLVHRVQQVLQVKRALDELQRSESSLAHAQRIARLGNWTWDPAADVVTWSAEVNKLLGVPPGVRSATMESFLARVHADRPDIAMRGVPDGRLVIHQIVGNATGGRKAPCGDEMTNPARLACHAIGHIGIARIIAGDRCRAVGP